MNSRTFIWNTSNTTFWIRKNNALLNLINYQPDIDKVDLFTKDPYGVKYELLIKKSEKIGLMHHGNLKAFVEYSNDM